MRRFVSTVAILFCIGSSTQAVTIDTVPIGNPGNDGDNISMLPGPGPGTVAYSYQIGTYEVTNSQYVEFLNAKAGSDPLGLYNTSMSDAGISLGGITRSGSDGSYTYAAISGRENKPVNWVSLYDTYRLRIGCTTAKETAIPKPARTHCWAQRPRRAMV